MSKPVLLVVDDEEYICKQIKWALNNDYEVITANESNEAIKKFSKYKPDIITLDLNLSVSDDQEEGFKVLEEIMSVDPYAKVIMVTAHDGKENAINSLRLGAYDYYIKPINMNELSIILNRAIYIRRLELENRQLQSQINKGWESLGILGNSKKIKKVINLIKRVARVDISVLIHGESGTGKELVARAIHQLSDRSNEAFIPIDSGAIPENLLESELFGHEKGAFTDAHCKKIGKVELANKGTLFFDEIAELPLSLQIKLLRFLQERQIQRLSGNEFIPIDVRVIAATNKDLEEEIRRKNFREDIFYRLNGITIELPPLREREDDIILISDYLIDNFCKGMKKKPKKLTMESIKAMKSYSWPGNIRELENKIKRALVLTTDAYLKPQDLGIPTNAYVLNDLTLKDAKDRLEKEMLLNNIEKYKGNLTKVAKSLGIARSTIYDLIEKYKIEYTKEKNRL